MAMKKSKSETMLPSPAPLPAVGAVESTPAIGDAMESTEEETLPLLPPSESHVSRSSAIGAPAPAPPSLPVVGDVIYALQSTHETLLELESLEPNLKNELIENQKESDEVLNGLVSHIGFLLLYTMGGLVLQTSNSIGCNSSIVISIVVSITFAIGLILTFMMSKMKMNPINERMSSLSERREDLRRRAHHTRQSEDVRSDSNSNALSTITKESAVARIDVLIKALDEKTFDCINRKMFYYIFFCGALYFAVINILFVFGNCEIKVILSHA